MDDIIYKQDAVDALIENKKMINAVLDSLTLDYNTRRNQEQRRGQINEDIETIKALSPAQPEDYTELKQEFLRMVSYIDVLLECSDAQKETLIGFISRLAKFMPWEGENNG